MTASAGCKLACRHVSDADIAALRVMHEEMVAHHARGDLPNYYRINRVIHERINAIAGWLWDRTVDRHYLTYGLGFDWKLTDTLQWTIETFGQAGTSDTPSAVRPRFQTGMRYRPNEIFSVDVIYGRNISGENANWITIGTTIRFPVPSGKPDHHRTGHL